MSKNSLLATEKLLKCQRCGGQLIRSWGEIDCLQCGALHTEEGKLLTHCAEELGLHLPRRRRRRSFGSYKKKQLSESIAGTNKS